MVAVSYIPIVNEQGSTIISNFVPPYGTPEFRTFFKERVAYKKQTLGRDLTNSELLAVLDSLKQLSGSPTLFPEQMYLSLQQTAQNLSPLNQIKEAFGNAGENIETSISKVNGTKSLSTISLVSMAVIAVVAYRFLRK